MKKMFSLLAVSGLLFTATACAQEDKSKRPSPPVTVTQSLDNGAVVTIGYGQPSLKGRTIGVDVEPKDGQVWRAGANEATVFEVSKQVNVEGQPLPAGKYALFMISGPEEWTIVFNKTWKTWGAYEYEKNKAEDALQVKVKPTKSTAPAEKLMYNVDKNGTVTLLWGDRKVSFKVS